MEKKGQEGEEEARIPVFTVLKNGAVLKNIFVISNKRTPSGGGEEEVLTVGRHPDCDVVLHHPSVSRFHLQLNTDPSSRKLFVTDLSSVHGTWVSDRKIEPLLRVEVREGDSIRVGGSTRVYKLHWAPLSSAYAAENLESDVAMEEDNNDHEIDRGNGEDGPQSNNGLLDPGMRPHEENSSVAANSHQEEEEEENQNLLAPGIEHFVTRSTLATVGKEQEKEENQVMQDKNSDTAGCREVRCFDSVLESITSLFSDEISAFGLKHEFLTEILMPGSSVTASSVHEDEMEILPENSLCSSQVSALVGERGVELEASCPSVCCHGDQSVSQAVPQGKVELCLMAALECKSEAAVTAGSFPSIDEVGFPLATDSTEETENKRFVTKDDGWTVNYILEKDPMDQYHDKDTSSDDVYKGNGITKCSLPIGQAEIGRSSLLPSASSADYPAVSNAPEQVANQFPSEESAKQIADGSLGVALLASEVLNSSFSSNDEDTSSDDGNKGSRITECSLSVGPVHKAEKEECLTEISNLLLSASSADYSAVSNAPKQVANQFPSEESAEPLADGNLQIALLATKVLDSSFSSSDEDTGSDDVNKGSRITECSLLKGPVRKAEKEECLADIGRSNLLPSASSADYPAVSNAPEQVDNQFPSEESAKQLADGSRGIALLASDVLNSSFSSSDEDTGSGDVNKESRITECSLPVRPVREAEKEERLAENGRSNLLPSARSADYPSVSNGPENGRSNLLPSARSADYPSVSNGPEHVAKQFPSEESAEQLTDGSLGIALVATEVLNSSFPGRQLVSDINNVKETQDSNFCSDIGRLKHSESPHVRSEKKLGNCSISSKRVELFASAQSSTLSAGRMVKGAESDCEANSESQWVADKASSIPSTDAEAVEKNNLLSDKEHNCTPKSPLVSTIRKHGKAEAVRDVTPCKSSSSKLDLSPCQDVIASCDKENQTPGAVHKRKSKGMTLMNYQDVIASCDKENQTPGAVHKRKSKGMTLVNQVGQKMSQEKRSGRVPLQQLNVNGVGNSKPDTSFSMDTTSRSSSVDCSRHVVANSAGKGLSEASFPTPKKLDLDGVGRRWTMVTDITTLLDKESRKSLQLLQGLRSTRLIIPRTVLEELACLEKQSSIFSGRRTDASLALDWIKKCTAESQWWVHLQKTEMEWSSTAKTSLSLLKFSTMTTSLQALVGWMTSEIISPAADDDLIDCALCYKRICSDEEFVLLSNNANLKTKAMAEGLVCETAPQFRNSLVNPFSERFLWGPSSPRGRTWSVVDDVMLKEHFYCSTSGYSERREWTKGLKIILLPSCTSGKSFSI